MALGGDHVHGVLQRTDDGGKVFPHGIKAAGADIVACRARCSCSAILRTARPSWACPVCVMYAGATVFDLMLPKIAADVPVTRADIAALGEGGLCLGCAECHYVS